MKSTNNQLTPFGKLVTKALVDQNMTKSELSRILHGVRPGEKHISAIIAALKLDPKKVKKAIAA